jgi:hypothetical protein
MTDNSSRMVVEQPCEFCEKTPRPNRSQSGVVGRAHNGKDCHWGLSEKRRFIDNTSKDRGEGKEQPREYYSQPSFG